MTPWIRKLHKWVGLIIALQFVVWTASGLTMSLLDADIVAGHQHRTDHADGPRAWPTGMLSPARVVAMAERPVQTVEAFGLQDRPVYQLVYASTPWLVDAANGKSVLVDSVIARGNAAGDLPGTGVRT